MDTDRQLVANGITTAYHGITVSWEPGLRSLASAARSVATLDLLHDRLAADHLLHIRWETFALNEIESVIALFERTRKPLLAFNDHTTPTMEGNRSATKLRGSTERAMVDLEEYMALMNGAWQRRDEVPGGMKRIAGAAKEYGITTLSHDDRSAEMRCAYRELGAGIAEFPMTAGALNAARAAGEPVILGAPNVVRGRSHNGAIDATTAVQAGQCSILASDYYYPSLLHAALKLAEEDFTKLEASWALISHNPACTAGLFDRGSLSPGARADLVIIADSRVTSTVVAGKVVFQM
jgi:alpha-D-ribose 1-methylphosphonate 5-triphosphate diphosphatase